MTNAVAGEQPPPALETLELVTHWYKVAGVPKLTIFTEALTFRGTALLSNSVCKSG